MKPPPPLHIPLNSKKKRVFMDPDVIEVPLPPAPIVSRSHTKQPKNKQGESYELSLAPTPIAVYGNTMRHGAMDIFWYSIET